MGAQKFTAIVLLVTLMLHTGLRVDRAHLFSVVKDWRLLGRAFLVNFIAVPAIGVALVDTFHVRPAIATGILLMAISPGVPFVIMAGGEKRDRSLGLAVALAFMLPALSVLTVPPTAGLVLPRQADISVLSVLTSLIVFQLLPLSAGMLLNARWPALARPVIKPLGIVVPLCLLVLIAILARSMLHAVSAVYGSYGFMAALCIVLCSLALGWIFGGPETEFRRTLATGTALRNVGLAAVVATQIGDPDVTAAVIGYVLVQFAVVTIFGFAYRRLTR